MIYLIDASVFVFRAWFSIPDRMTDPNGEPVNAVYGFASFLGEFLLRARPEMVAVAFDESQRADRGCRRQGRRGQLAGPVAC